MYHLSGGLKVYDAPEDPYQRVLFNTCDSSVYHFGGDTFRFSKVVRNYLQHWPEKDSALSLLRFYINTLELEDAYYIFKLPSDFDDICKAWVLRDGVLDTFYYPLKIWERDKNIVSRIVEPFAYRSGRCFARIDFYSWDHTYGKIERWRVVMNGEFFQVLERREMVRDIGPHLLVP